MKDGKMKFRKRAMMLLMTLLCFSAIPLKAQTTWTPNTPWWGGGSVEYTITPYGNNTFRVNNSGNYNAIGGFTMNTSNSNITINFNFTNDRTINLSGTIVCTQGTINLINIGSAPVTLRRSTTGPGGHMIVLDPVTNAAPSTCVINITGGEGHEIAIDGNCHEMDFVYTNYDEPNPDCRVEATGYPISGGSGQAIIGVHGGTLNMDYAALQYNWTNGGVSGGGMVVGQSSGSQGDGIKSKCLINIDHSKFDHLYTYGHGGGIYFNNRKRNNQPDPSDSHAYINNTEFSYCYSKYNTQNYPNSSYGGGAFRGMGDNLCTLDMEGGEIHHCYADDDGGGCRWNSSLIPPATLTNTYIHDNWCGDMGGGIRVEGLIEIIGCTITNNRANHHGGGVAMANFVEGKPEHLMGEDQWDPSDGIISLNGNTLIENNYAGLNGGGMHFSNAFIRFLESPQSPNVIMRFFQHPDGTPFKVALDVSGAIIRDNLAGRDGGGVYMERETNLYGLEALLNFGSIYDNEALRHGGGVAIEEILQDDPYHNFDPNFNYYDPHTHQYYNNLQPQPIFLHLGAEDETITTPMLVENNSAIDGGGVYMTYGDVDVYHNAVVGTEGKANIASGNGGGVCITSNLEGIIGSGEGDLLVHGGLISYNQAANHGGGFYVDGGSVEVRGGTVTENDADNYGGGFYISIDADKTVKINSTEATTTISDNTAKRGAGAYIDQGKLLIENTETTIVGNHASDRGGGIYLNQGEFHMIDASIGVEDHGNIADGTGGGAYINNGKFTMENGHLDYNIGTAGGGGAYINYPNSVTPGEVEITNSTVSYNTTLNNSSNGGGVYVNRGIASIKSSTFIGNEAVGSGGGIYSEGISSVVVVDRLDENSNDCLFQSNSAQNGGGIYARCYSVDVGNTLFDSNTATSNGGGIYVTRSGNNEHATVTLHPETTLIKNEADNSGGGVYVSNGVFTMGDGVTVGGSEENGNKANSTTGNNGGGGIYVTGNASEVNVLGGEISYNTSNRHGGGLYVASTGPDGTNIIGDVLIDHNSAATNGGGTYVQNGLLNLNGEDVIVSNNQAKDGGGIYMNNGTVNLISTQILDNVANNGRGGGIYLGNSTDEGMTVSAAIISGNQATTETPGTIDNTGQGGGIYCGYGTILVKDASQIGTYGTDNAEGSGNTAKQGGGLYVNGGSVTFSGGTFAENYASMQGGGIYIKEGAVLNMKDNAEIKYNYVPADGFGGGVYQNGTFYLGGGTVANLQTLKAYTNYAGSEETINNVYLPSNNKFITLKSDVDAQTSLPTYITNIGITTNPAEPHPHPVIHVEDVSNESWLWNMMNSISHGNGSVFDDTETHVCIHTGEDYPSQKFYKDFIYFDGCWTTAVTKDPQIHQDIYPITNGSDNHYTVDEDGAWHIYTTEALAWFISYVNNLNGCTGEHRGTNAFIENDIDMSANRWVPIGAVTSYDPASSTFMEDDIEGNKYYYTGTCDGQGNLVTGIRNGFLSGISLYGMFGATQGTLKNIFLDNYDNFAAKVADNDDYVYYMGGVAGIVNDGTVSNCEARGTMDAQYWHDAYMGGLVARIEGGSVHSSMAMPIMRGEADYMGGLVGELLADNSLKNCYSYADITRTEDYTVIGGLVAHNLGTVENCYSRLQGDNPTNFGWFAGINDGTILYCYAPNGESLYVADGDDPTASGNYNATALVSTKYGFAHTDQQITAENDYVENGPIGYVEEEDEHFGELKGLLATLNNWVEAQTGDEEFSTWSRTLASPVNDDYPILEFNDFVCLGSKDNIYLLYRYDLNAMIGLMNRDDLYTTMGLINGNQEGGNIFLYATTDEINVDTEEDVRVYIDENIGVTQADGNIVYARVGVTFDNSDGSMLGYAPYDWHMFSSALSEPPMGLIYHTREPGYPGVDNYYLTANGFDNFVANGIEGTDYKDRNKMDPPMTTWDTENLGYFPTDSPYGTWRPDWDGGNTAAQLGGSFDFYCYSEEYYHWINFKREGVEGFLDHWHENEDINNYHQNIPYLNETEMVNAKGYLMAVSETSMLMTSGTLNNGTISQDVTYTELTGYETPLRGVNLIGNPFQSYINFDEFATCNLNNGKIKSNTCYILDADQNGYIARVAGGSIPSPGEHHVQSYTAPQYLHPHQGFFVRVESDQRLNFTNDMRLAEGNAEESYFRNEAPHYPMVNLKCTDAQGRNDFATIELDRPEVGGGEKIKGLRTGNASIWFRLEDKDYQVAFAPVGTTSALLRFNAYNNEVYKLQWNTANADFHYLHLIDNLTGMDIDCLTTDQYVFEGNTEDYNTRFRLMFGFTGVEEDEDDNTTISQNFAFQMGDELVVNGDGVLQVFDFNGRQIMHTQIHGQQNAVSLPNVANGVYVLRLTNNNQVRTQKMVINK